MAGGLIGQRFRLGDLVGSGGSGRVYRGVDVRNGAPVAIKILPGDGGAVGERLSREAQILNLLDHPGIVRYVDHGPIDEDEYFLGMEWLEGEDLATRLGRGPIALDEAVALMTSVADALGHAHAHKVVHRDIKPANIFLQRAGGVTTTKLVDFGIAKPITSKRAGGTRAGQGATSITGVPIGTIGYMAPEQARGVRQIDARVDVFALGCVLYECLVDRPAFAGEHALAVLAKILLQAPERLSLAAARPIPTWLDELVSSMLAHDPSGRPQDASVVARLLRQHALDGEAVPRTAAPSPRALTTRERKLTTAVAVSPSSESFAARVPELGRAHGCTLEALADGTWVTLLRMSESATDTGSRAARLALSLRALGQVAVATSFDESDRTRPTGNALDRVFRLFDHPSGHEGPVVAVDSLTAGLIDSAFVVAREEGDPGASAERPAILVGPRHDPDPRRLLLGKVTPFVGRDRELAVLSSTLGATLSEPTASAVFILGPAGVGKSRLRHELVAAATREHPSLRVLLVRAEPSRQSTALGVVGALVAAEARLHEDDEPALRRDRLRERLAVSLPASELDRVAGFLGELAGAPPEEPSVLLQGAKADPRRMWTETLRALEDWIAGEIELGPVLLVLEDVQWIDAQSLHLFAELLGRRERPLLLLGLGRPAVRAMIAATGWQARPLQMLQLPPLGARASEQLIRGTLGDTVSQERLTAMVTWGEGHAFYLEELVRAEAEGRGATAPATVVAMLQERFDRFEADARRILRAASVYGLEFTKAGLHALLGDDEGPSAWLDPWLATLVKREVIGRAERPRFHREETYAFRHDLVHESIYATLTEDDRRRGHLLAARWLEAAGERDPALLGDHYERGGDLERAAVAFARAAEETYKRMDFDVALRLCDRSVANGATGGTLGWVRWVQASIALAARTMNDAAQYGLEALELLPEGAPHWFHAATVMVAIAAFGRPELLGELVGKVMRAGVPPDDGLGVAPIRTWALSANMLYFAGQYAMAAEFDARIERCADVAIANESAAEAWIRFSRHVKASYCAGDPEFTLDEASRAAAILEQYSDEILVWVRVEEAKAAALIGDFARAESLLTRALAMAGTDNLWAAGLARHRLARVHVYTGRLEEARALELRAIQVFHDINMPIMAAIGDNHLALIELAAGQLPAAHTAIERASDLLYAAPPVRTFALSTKALIALASGDPASARLALEEAEQAIPTSGLINDGESQYELAWVETLLALGDTEGALQWARRGGERLRGRASRIEREAHRLSFLEAVPENVALLRYERTLARAKESSEAAACVR